MWNAKWERIGSSMSAFVALLTLVVAIPVMAADTANIVGADECGQCHKKEIAAWRSSKHYKTFRELSRTKKAKEIAKKMGLKRIKHESDCINCHFTQREVRGKLRAVSGITCESCHGPAKKWLKDHSDYGGKDVKKEQETSAHRKQRLAKVDKAGMIRPSDLYGVANNCYQCHLVPNEKLVNVGGHKAGSNFNLVAWSQGEVRHNYWNSPDGKTNSPASAKRKRIMFVLSDALELEHALRAVGKATVKADYSVKMAKRVKKSTGRLKQIGSLVKAPEINNMAKIGGTAKLSLNNGAQLNKIADQVAKLAKQFVAKYDGSAFSALDKYIPKKTVGHAHD